MANSIIKSSFKRKQTPFRWALEKYRKQSSPLKNIMPFVISVGGGGAGTAYSTAMSEDNNLKDRFGSKERLRQLRDDFGGLSTGNLSAGIKNPYANVQTEFENVYEDAIGVDRTATDLATQEFQQNLSTTLSKMQEMGTISAQQLANASMRQSQQTRATLGGQIREGQMLAAKGAESVQQREQQAKMTQMQGAWMADQAIRQGAADARNLEYQKIQGLMALEAGELQSARQARIANKNWFQRVFSDRRLKHDIVFVKKSNSGINIYNFQYKDNKFGKGVYQGVMSDEIPSEAILKHSSGYDMVDYSKIDVNFIKIKN